MIVMKHFDLGDIPEIQKVGVYAIHNKTNDKYYVGSTTNLYHRFSLYYRSFIEGCGINRKMDEDFKSCEQFCDFEIIIIEEFENNEITNLQLRRKEWEYIKKYNAIDNGYNTYMPSIGNIPAHQKLVSKDYMSERRKNSIVLFVPKPIKEEAKRQAKKQKMTLSQYICWLIDDEIDKAQKEIV